ncbi:heavy-metal-associated domain-containing protein [Anabaena catenula]|uniref:Heavy-metal-associated domain-containing protein n=1 Tax=Anabaena catenula FACHB-362 TaxID=2692877 RepID=A0ABR8IZN1_9NOST|nr:heavy-metal-associated domain-containing protein [Anabaena catenula]MBD2691508.1 heavy-metal-associated domain-containing protein [Anabaena catenula FACHB-362]
MALKIKVSNLAGEKCAKTITESIHTMMPDAKVDVDVQAKTVTVEPTASESIASEDSIKQVIVAAGYHIEGY